MGKIIAVANQKGGVGKTTTCVNLTCVLKKRGRRVLLVDCDPQGNSTSGMGVDKTATPNCYDMLMNGAAADEQFLAQVSAVVILFCCGGWGNCGCDNNNNNGCGCGC